MIILGFLAGIMLSIQAPKISLEISEGTNDEIPYIYKPLSPQDYLNENNSYWVKVNLEVLIGGNYVLKGGEAYLQNMEFYSSDRSHIGDGNHIELLLQTGQNTIYIYYPFLDQKEVNGIAISVFDSAEYYKKSLKDKLIKAIFTALVLFIFFLSLAFYISVRMTEIIYLTYALYLFSVFYFFAYQFGFLGYFFPVINAIHPIIIWISSASITATYVLFCQSFLNLKETEPLLNKILNYSLWFVGFVVASETVSFIVQYDLQHSVIFSTFSLLTQSVLFITILYRLYLMKTTLSLIALTSVLILAATSLSAQLVSTLKLVAETNYLIMAGLSLEIFVINLAIGFRILIIHKEKRKAQFELIDQLRINEKIQEESNIQLELKVDERTEELKVKNRQNEILLGEVHHRVKNNLQTIASLLSIQQRKLNDPESIKAIQDSKHRVKAMGLIHEHLYQNTSFAEIDFKNYVKELVNALIQTYSILETKPKVKIEIPSVKIEVDSAIFLGLIVNELVNNSLKYAFVGVDKPILEVLMFESNDQMVLKVKDNGQGKNVDFENPKSFGWKLVNVMGQKLGGKLDVEDSDGLTVYLYFSTNLVRTV